MFVDLQGICCSLTCRIGCPCIVQDVLNKHGWYVPFSDVHCQSLVVPAHNLGTYPVTMLEVVVEILLTLELGYHRIQLDQDKDESRPRQQYRTAFTPACRRIRLS